MWKRLKDVLEYRDFLREFALQQLRLRYQSSVLGFLWTLLNPLLVYVSFCLVFSVVNHWDLKSYGIYFFSGYMAWTFFSTASLLAADSVVGNATYITRVYVPKAVFPLSSIALSLVDLLASFAVLGVVMLVLKAQFSMALLFLPVSALLLVVFVSGVCFLTAAWTVFLRDFKQVLNSVLFVWFFFCPILYRSDVIPEAARRYFNLNPMVPFIRLFQEPISSGRLPDRSDLITGSALAVVVLLSGIYLFLKSENRFYYYV